MEEKVMHFFENYLLSNFMTIPFGTYIEMRKRCVFQLLDYVTLK